MGCNPFISGSFCKATSRLVLFKETHYLLVCTISRSYQSKRGAKAKKSKNKQKRLKYKRQTSRKIFAFVFAFAWCGYSFTQDNFESERETFLWCFVVSQCVNATFDFIRTHLSLCQSQSLGPIDTKLNRKRPKKNKQKRSKNKRLTLKRILAFARCERVLNEGDVSFKNSSEI